MKRLLCLGLCLLTGCAVLPQFMQPNAAESTWLGLDAVDTLQTVQVAKHPDCYREGDGIAAGLYGSNHPNAGTVVGVNFALAMAHLAVASWLDREVDRHLAADAAEPGLDSVGPWYVGRIIFHTVSLLGSGYAVGNNFSNGVRPWGITSNCTRSMHHGDVLLHHGPT